MLHTEPLKEAIVAIVGGDATLQATMGRATNLIMPWEDGAILGQDSTPLPLVNYLVVNLDEGGGQGQSWMGLVQLTAHAEGLGSVRMVEDILDRLGDLLTFAAFNAEGLDAAVMHWRRLDVPVVREETRLLARGDIEADVTITY
jgi:hypothetical protein